MNIYFSNKTWVQAAAYYLRMTVFVQEQGIPLTLEFDHFDTDQREYVLIMNDSQPVGTVRYQLANPTTLQPDRLCVALAYRHQGIGQQLLAIIEERACREGCLLSELSAEITATDFYLKLGYHVSSQPFLEDGIPCLKMTKKLLRNDSQ